MSLEEKEFLDKTTNQEQYQKEPHGQDLFSKQQSGSRNSNRSSPERSSDKGENPCRRKVIFFWIWHSI